MFNILKQLFKKQESPQMQEDEEKNELEFKKGDFVYLKTLDDRLYEGRMQIVDIEYSSSLNEYVAITQGTRGRGMFTFSSLERG